MIVSGRVNSILCLVITNALFPGPPATPYFGLIGRKAAYMKTNSPPTFANYLPASCTAFHSAECLEVQHTPCGGRVKLVKLVRRGWGLLCFNCFDAFEEEMHLDLEKTWTK